MTDFSPPDHNEVRKCLSQRESLPTLPTTFTKLIRVTGNPKATLLELVEIISHDPVLTANVLKVSNSAYMGLNEPVEDLSAATLYLGMREISRIALSVGYFDVFAAKGPSSDFLKNIWLHSVAVALMAWRIASVGKFEFAKDSYLAGLLHDMGKLFFASSYTKVYASVCQRISVGENKGLVLETEVFGITHIEVAEDLCRHWNMPAKIVEVTTKHHDPMSISEENRPLGLCIAVANVLAHHLLQDVPIHVQPPEMEDWLKELSAISSVPDQLLLEQLLPALEQEVERARQFMATSARKA